MALSSTPASLVYNERSWGIDLVSAVNAYASARSVEVKRATGEQSLGGGRTMFPDLILHGDSAGTSVLQGWELKMPETPLTDAELLGNAATKARRLKLNSFLVWNARDAELHVEDEAGAFVPVKAWRCDAIVNRADVKANEGAWTATLHGILDDLNVFMATGQVRPASLATVLGEYLLTDYLTARQGVLSDHLLALTSTDATFEADLADWWKTNKVEHPKLKPYQGFARISIVAWVNRFVFAHLLKRTRSEAAEVEGVVSGTSIASAVTTFQGISAKCDFLNILKPLDYEDRLDPGTWTSMLELNDFLTGTTLKSMPDGVLQQVLNLVIDSARKKVAGQFATPRALADLLVGVTMLNREATVLDPCCGTGTIARAAFDLKVRKGIAPKVALSDVWAGDRYAFPLQLATMAMAEPSAYGEVVQAFRQDVLALAAGQAIEFTNPETGAAETRILPTVGAVVSNLPFVRFEVRPGVAMPAGINAKADLYAAILPQLADLVAAGGRVGVITSNSWLGTQWGPGFRAAIRKLFHLDVVAIAGAGRWFSNADVVTTLLVLTRRTNGDTTDKPISFVVADERIESWTSGEGGVEGLAMRVIKKADPTDRLRRVKRTHPEIVTLGKVGIGWNAMFADSSWVAVVAPKLVAANTAFSIARGDRWGCNGLFHPKPGHGIESEFITGMLKSPRSFLRFDAHANAETFCCDLSMTELQAGEYTGAIAWINRFVNALNGQGLPWPQVLGKGGQLWYSRRSAHRPNFAMPISYGPRLMVFSVPDRVPVDQRVTAMTMLDSNGDAELWHALLNCSVGLYLVEAMGFGRGLGALDLNSEKVADSFHVLDAGQLDNAGRASIKEAFVPIRARNVLPVPAEMADADRHALDAAVFAAFGLEDTGAKVRDSLLTLFTIRNAVRSSASLDDISDEDADEDG